VQQVGTFRHCVGDTHDPPAADMRERHAPRPDARGASGRDHHAGRGSVLVVFVVEREVVVVLIVVEILFVAVQVLVVVEVVVLVLVVVEAEVLVRLFSVFIEPPLHEDPILFQRRPEGRLPRRHTDLH
jgi:hypothetical protein